MVAAGDAEAVGATPVVEGRARQRVEVAWVGRADGDALAEPAVHSRLVDELEAHAVRKRPGQLVVVPDRAERRSGLVPELYDLRREAVERPSPADSGGPHQPLDE